MDDVLAHGVLTAPLWANLVKRDVFQATGDAVRHRL